MIFVTLGSQKFQFNRLLEALDQLIEDGSLKDEVFAQIGYSEYHPRNYSYEKFMDRDSFSDKMQQADIIITHGGTGAIVGAVKKKKKVIAVPRKSEFGEHVDDHQIQIVDQFASMNYVCPCYDTNCLGAAIESAKSSEYDEYYSNAGTIIDDIIRYIEE